MFTYGPIRRDDAYIFIQFARNIANGHGWSFNPGQPVNGTTSPLYTIVLAVGYALARGTGVDVPEVAFIVGLLSLWIGAAVGASLLNQCGRRTAALLFPILYLWNPLLGNGVGMETFLTMGLMLTTLHLYLSSRIKWSMAVGGLLVLSRPDGLLLLLVMVFDFAVSQRRILNPAYTLPLAIVSPWLVFAYLTFGSALPLTLSAKLGQSHTGYWGTGLVWLKGLARFIPWKTVALCALFLWWRRRCWRALPLDRILLYWAILYVLVYGLALNPPAYQWYYVPLLLPITFLVALAAEAFTGLAKPPTRRLALAAVALIALLCARTIVFPTVRGAPEGNDKYVAYRAAANWLNANASPGASVGCAEIGVLGYYYRKGPVIDALGLVTPGVARHVADGDYEWYVHKLRPDFLVFYHPHRRILEDMADAEWFRREYSCTLIPADDHYLAIWRRTTKSRNGGG